MHVAPTSRNGTPSSGGTTRSRACAAIPTSTSSWSRCRTDSISRRSRPRCPPARASSVRSPSAATAPRRPRCSRLVREAGVFNGYLENEVFCPEVIRVQEMVASGSLGRVLTMRAREGHSGPHADHFWQAEEAGGGAFLDMGCHCIEAVRYIVGKDVPIRDVFAWGATLAHGDRTSGEDNAIAILRFEDGRTATIEASWTAKGGIEVRNEIYCERGRIVHDIGATPIRAFLEEPVGYLAEKTDAETGWVYPIADEPRVAGYDEQFRHFVDCFAAGTTPRETFEDGYIVNTIIDAAYRSMRSGRWEPVESPSRVPVGSSSGIGDR